jgi:hypothetical protein
MFADYVFEKSSAAYSNRILLIDADDLQSTMDYCAIFSAHGFQVIRYVDDLRLRTEHDDAINGSSGKFALLANPKSYIPYDVRRRFRCFEISFSNLFPKLNVSAIRDAGNLNLDLLNMAYQRNYSDLKPYPLTQQFIEN